MTGLELSSAGDVTFDLLKKQYRIGNLGIGFKGANGADALAGELKLAGARGSERTLVVPKFSADVSITSPDLPAVVRTLRLPLSGSLKANFEKQTASAELAGKIDESTLQAKFGLAKFTPPSYLFDVNVDRLNLDRYLAPEQPAAQAKAALGKPIETPIDLAPLRGLDATGKLQIGALQVRGLRLTEVRAEARAAGGRVDIAPHEARLYDGTVAGALALEADGNRVSLKETLSDVSVDLMLKDVVQRENVEGRGSVALDVVASGNTVEAMKRALAGTAKVNLREGALKGFDALDILHKAQTLVGAQRARPADRNAKTEFGELAASFTISDGVARNDDLDVKAKGLRISGAGTIDIGRSRIDYRLRPTLVTNARGQGVTVPVRLTGSLEDMQHEVDYGAAARTGVKQVGRSIRDGVKGLFKR
jgi:AsmA protein